jgi:hypothetical protein
VVSDVTDVLVKPAFQSTFPDTGDPTSFGPSAWNAARMFNGGNDGDVPVRDSLAATGASWGTRTRVLTVSVAQSGTPANTNETDLWTYTLPANTLDADGRGVRIDTWGSIANNANLKSVRLKFGGSTIAFRLTVADSNFSWNAYATVLRTSATTQISLGYYDFSGGAHVIFQTALAATMSSPIIINLTGQNGTSNANDVLLKAAMVELL